MSETVPPTLKRPSKAALRHEAFYSVRTVPMRPRSTTEADDSPKVEGQEGSAESEIEPKKPSYLAAKRTYRDRQRATRERAREVANRGTSIGPSAVRKGLAGNRPIVSGRVSSIAVAPGGGRVYIGSANGGVWRSEDRGATWTPLMEAFDLNPESDGSDSLAVGALALVPGDSADTDVIYVGSGEAIDGAENPVGGPMFGVGPIVSTNGGQDWRTELGAPGGVWSRLEGNGFYELAVDPSDTTRVLAATLTGLFVREPAPLSTGFFRWRHVGLPGLARSNPVTSVVAARAEGGSTVFFASIPGGTVFRSVDGGETWATFGTGVPNTAGRTRLAVEPTNPDVVYHFTSAFELYRWSAIDDRWRFLFRLNTSATGTSGPQAHNVNGQWNLTVSVAPGNVNRVYVGGGATGINDEGWLIEQNTSFGATLFRCDVTANTSSTGGLGTVTSSRHYIGGSVHPDVHAIAFPPGSAEEMWVGCDGGVFYSDNPPGEDGGLIPSPNGPSPERFYFQAKNTGLQTLMLQYIGQHPTEDAVVFAGTQDNGCLRYTGEAVWLHAISGDCGSVLVHSNNPYRVMAGLQFDSSRARPRIVRSRLGGNLDTFDSLPNGPTGVDSRTLFYYPLASPPPGAGAPGRVAFGSLQVWLSEDFGQTWETVPDNDPDADELVGPIRTITFASADRFFVGTHSNGTTFPVMGVYRFDRVNGQFQPTRIDTSAFPGLPSLPFDASVSDIAIDWSDSTGNSIYVSFSGWGVFGHVWHYDGAFWRRKDGGNPGQPGTLLDVSHNAIVVDPESPDTVYVGADIGVWRSTDRGNTWEPFSEELPDAAVIDLKIHPRRLLRAATHGRGAFERRLDTTVIQDTELFIRDTQLDLGRRNTEDGLDNPIRRYNQVFHWKGPDIRLDFPDSQGRFQLESRQPLDFVEFIDELKDDGLGYGYWLSPGDTHRIYAQIHNRGPERADGVQVMALITPATTGLPPMPGNYEEHVQQGIPIEDDNWTTVGISTVDNVTARTPQIVRFDVPPELLPPPTNDQGAFAYSVLILVHHPEDVYPVTPFQGTPGGLQFRIIPPVDVICRTRRLAAVKSTTQQPITLVSIDADPPLLYFPLTFFEPEKTPRIRIRFIRWTFVGKAKFFVPKGRLKENWQKWIEGFKPPRDQEESIRELADWAETYAESLEKQSREKGAFHQGWTKQRLAAVRRTVEEGVAFERVEAKEWVFDGFEPNGKEPIQVILQIQAEHSEKEPAKELEVELVVESEREKGAFEVIGGQTIRVPLEYRKK